MSGGTLHIALLFQTFLIIISLFRDILRDMAK